MTNPVGRPRKYLSDEIAKEVYATKARERYADKVVNVREYKKDKDAEKFRGTQEYRMYHGIKTRAKQNNLAFDLDVQFIKDLLDASTVCPLLDVEYDMQKYIKSIDKRIPSLGYVKSNVWVVSRRANTIKNDASLEELELIVANMRKNNF